MDGAALDYRIRMALAIDERNVRQAACPHCGQPLEHVTGFVKNGAAAYAVYFASCHVEPSREAAIDVVLGTWGTVPAIDDHLTFSCRLRAAGAMAEDAPLATSSDSTMLGHCLSRADALAHPLRQEFWAVIDLLAEADPTIKSCVYKT